jgi:hypothetical protein
VTSLTIRILWTYPYAQYCERTRMSNTAKAPVCPIRWTYPYAQYCERSRMPNTANVPVCPIQWTYPYAQYCERTRMPNTPPLLKDHCFLDSSLTSPVRPYDSSNINMQMCMDNTDRAQQKCWKKNLSATNWNRAPGLGSDTPATNRLNTKSTLYTNIKFRAAWFQVPTFRDNLSAPSSRVKNFKKKKEDVLTAAYGTNRSVRNCHFTLREVQEQRESQGHTSPRTRRPSTS